jgi:hypothetical protein
MTRISVGVFGAFVLAVVAVACGDDDPSGPPAPVFTSLSAEPVPDNGLASRAVVRANGFDSMRVRALLPGGDEAVVTPAVVFEGDSVARVDVLGLHLETAYRIVADLWDGTTLETAPDTADFATGARPAWIPAMTAVGTDTIPGLVLLSLPDGAAIVDNQAELVWYRPFATNQLTSFTAHADGSYTLAATLGTGGEILSLDGAGREVGRIACVNGRPTRFHDVLVVADGTRWLLCDETRVMDLSGLGGNAAAQVLGTVVQEVSPSGTLLFEWNSFDHFAITDLPAADRMGLNVNFTHGNGVALDSDGNLLLSFRSLSEVTSVDPETGDVLWRFGGLANQFTIQNDPKGLFERQHGVRPAGPSHLQMLDNGLAAPSRMVRYLVNPTTLTATMVWQFIDAPTTFTFVGGSTQALPLEDRALVSFGQAGRVVEVDAAGNRAWELQGTEGMYVFRAQRIAGLYR